MDTIATLLPQPLQARLKAAPAAWLVTGAAGFIGSNLVEALLALDQTVVGLNNLATSYQTHSDEVRRRIGPEARTRFRFIEGDFRAGDVLHSLADIGKAMHRLDYAPSHNLRDGLGVAIPWYPRASIRAPAAECLTAPPTVTGRPS